MAELQQAADRAHVDRKMITLVPNLSHQLSVMGAHKDQEGPLCWVHQLYSAVILHLVWNLTDHDRSSAVALNLPRHLSEKAVAYLPVHFLMVQMWRKPYRARALRRTYRSSALLSSVEDHEEGPHASHLVGFVFQLPKHCVSLLQQLAAAGHCAAHDGHFELRG